MRKILRFLLLVTVSVSCSKKDDPAATSHCYPSKFVYVETYPSQGTKNYSIDCTLSSGKVTLITITNEDNQQKYRLAIAYDGAGNPVSLAGSDDSGPDKTVVISYSSGKITQAHLDGFLYYEFDYDNQGRVTQEKYYEADNPGDPSILDWTFTFQYPGTSLNASSLIGVNVSGSTYTHNIEYDDKRNAFADLGILWNAMRIYLDGEGQIASAQGLEDPEFFCANNVTLVESVGSGSTTSLVYEYNSKGLPTKITGVLSAGPDSSNWTATFEYSCQ